MGDSVLALLCLFIVMVPIGHGVWVFLARVFRDPTSTDDRRRSPSTTCPLCRTRYSRARPRCPECELDPHSKIARELRELHTTVDQINTLRDVDKLDREAADQVLWAVRERRRRLIRAAGLSPPIDLESEAQPEPAEMLAELEELLGRTKDVAELPVDQKKRALALYRKMGADDVQWLSPEALLSLARMLSFVGLTSRSLHTYRLLVEKHAETDAAQSALSEAATLAEQQGQPDVAEWFHQRLRKPPTAERHETPEEEPPLRAILVEPSPVAEVAPPERTAEPVPPNVVRPVAPRKTEEKPPPPPKPRRSLGEWLAAFMEERNILWGELVGGLLIVGCSIALVLSLWQTLEQIQYFPFLIMAAITSALFGAGFYTLSHWKLESTSRGLLVIATLLTPLNFTVLAGLVQDSPGNLVVIGTELLSALVFLGFTARAGRSLLGDDIVQLTTANWWMAAAVLGAAASQLLVPRFDVSAAGWHAGLLAMLPIATFGVASGVVLWQSSRSSSWTVSRSNGLLTLLGLTAFAAIIALGFLIYWSDERSALWSHLAMPAAVFAIPIVVSGATVYRVATRDDKMPGALAVTATIVALTGTAIQLLAIALAWPSPLPLLIVGLLNFVVLFASALGFRFPAAHVPAMASLTVGFLTAFHWVTSGIDGGSHLWRLIFTPETGIGLLVLIVFFAAIAELLVRRERREDGLRLILGSGVLAVLALLLVTFPYLPLWEAPYRLGLLGLIVLVAIFAEVFIRRDWSDAATKWTLTIASLAGLIVLLATLPYLVLLTLSYQIDSHNSMLAACVYGVCGFGGLLVNARWRQVWLSYISGGVVLFGMCFLLSWIRPTGPVDRSVVLAALTYATVMLLASLAFRYYTSRPDNHALFVAPLYRLALTASFLSIPAMLTALEWSWLPLGSAAAVWLALIWLVVAWTESKPVWFAAFQIALSWAVVLTASAWLHWQGWIGEHVTDLFAPSSLHVIGAGLALLCLLWEITRIGLRHREGAMHLLEPNWPSTDRVLNGILVIGQWALVGWAVLFGVTQQLTPRGFEIRQPNFEWLPDAFHPSGWALFAAVGSATVVGFVRGRRYWTLLQMALLLLTAPLLVAGHFHDDLAVGSAMSWGLAVAFLVIALLLWIRDPLSRMFGQSTDVPRPAAFHSIAIAGAALPVLAVTFVMAVIAFSGWRTAGPLPDSVFGQLGKFYTFLIPVCLITAGFAVFGVREQQSGYMLTGGLLAVAAVTGGYALKIVLRDGWLDAPHTIRTIQYGIIAAEAWAIFWIACGLWKRWDDKKPPLHETSLLPVQIHLGTLTFAFSLGIGFLLSVFGKLGVLPSIEFLDEIGSWRSWLALATGVVCLGWTRWLRRKPITPEVIGVGGLLIAMLAGLSAEYIATGWSYPTWLLAFAWFASIFALLSRRMKLAGFVVIGAALSVGLALASASAGLHHDWGAAGSALAGAALSILSWQMRRERWFADAVFCFLVAASLSVWHLNIGVPILEWLVVLIQVNLSVVGVAALVWLSLRRFAVERTPADALPMSLWLIGGWIGNILLLGTVALSLFVTPDVLMTPLISDAGRIAGWLALLPMWVAVLWRFHAERPLWLATGGAMLGVLTACTTTLFVPEGWVAYHVLTASWATLGITLLMASWLADANNLESVQAWFPKKQIRSLLGLLCAAVVVLAVRGAWGDPQMPYWSCGAVLSVSVLLGAMALWSRSQGFVYASGFTANIIGFLLWKAWVLDVTDQPISSFLFIQIISMAAASAIWLIIETWLAQREPAVILQTRRTPFCHFVALLGVYSLAVMIGSAVACDLIGERLALHEQFGWAAMGAVLLALIAIFWDRQTSALSIPLPQLFLGGLLIPAFALHQADLSPTDLLWYSMLAMSGYALLAAMITLVPRWLWAVIFPRLAMLRESQVWFATGQLILCIAAVLLSLWVVFSLPLLDDRFAGPLTVALVIPMGWMLHRLFVDAETEHLGKLWRSAALTLFVLALAEVQWAFLSPDMPLVWLHRTALLFTALVLAHALYAILPPLLLSENHPWRNAVRRASVATAVSAGVVLLLCLAQELTHYDADASVTAMQMPVVVAVAAALTVLIALILWYALVPKRDPLSLSEKGRMGYVYGAEALLVLMMVHVRLTKPDLFPSFIGGYWPIVIMGVAFLGVGLSELFHRKGVKVLATPLQQTGIFLPVLPILAFLVHPLTGLRNAAKEQVPGLQPLLRYLERMDDMQSLFAQHALVWFLVGLLYLTVAFSRRSTNFALLAALAANFGLWVIFDHTGVSFWTHPQCWLIPLGLIVIAAEFINRDRLPMSARMTLRYTGLMLIYLSSTADMFIAGLGESIILPIVLAVLSVLGVLCGILLRVRAFLFLGIAFLGMVVFAQIWHAAVDRQHTWVWWASGIVLGVLILTMFALFEKHRNEVTKVLKDMKRWE